MRLRTSRSALAVTAKVIAMIRNVVPLDISPVRKLVQACVPLTLHTAVTYGVLFRHFADTCFVAEHSGKLIGYISGVRGTSHSNAIYLCQIGVVPSARRKGLAHELIDAVVVAARCLGCTALQVGIEPSNAISLSVFRAYARKKDTALTEIDRIDFTDEISGISEYDTVWEMPIHG